MPNANNLLHSPRFWIAAFATVVGCWNAFCGYFVGPHLAESVKFVAMVAGFVFGIANVIIWFAEPFHEEKEQWAVAPVPPERIKALVDSIVSPECPLAERVWAIFTEICVGLPSRMEGKLSLTPAGFGDFSIVFHEGSEDDDLPAWVKPHRIQAMWPDLPTGIAILASILQEKRDHEARP